MPRNFTERAFENVKSDFEYGFVQNLTALDELDDKKQELLSRKATFLMKYDGKQHPVCILLEKCTEAFILLFGDDIGDVLDDILNKIFLKIMKQHQDRISGMEFDGRIQTREYQEYLKIQVKAYLHSERFRLKFRRKSVTLRGLWLCCFSRHNFKWNP